MGRVVIGHAPDLLGKASSYQLEGIDACYYLGQDKSTRVALERELESLQGCWRSIACDIDHVSRGLRQAFIDFIGLLSAINDTPLWWSTELANKSSFGCPLFFQICMVEVAVRAAAESNSSILFVADDPALLEALHLNISQSEVVRNHDTATYTKKQLIAPLLSIKNGLRVLKKVYERREIIKKGSKPISIRESDSDSVLLFTWLDGRSFSKAGEYTDSYWGLLATSLRERGYRVIVVPRILPSLDLSEALRLINDSRQEFLLMEAILTKADLCSAFIKSLVFEPSILEEMKVGRIAIHPLVTECMRREKRSLISIEALLYYYFARQLANIGIHPEYVLITSEGHPWERALTYGVRLHLNGTKLVAYENITFSKMLLSQYPAEVESSTFPFPHRIITNGAASVEQFITNGYDPEVIVEGAAIRHEYLWSLGRKAERNFVGDACHVVVATSIDPGDSIELIEKVLTAFRERPSYRVSIKCHPAVPISSIVQTLDEVWSQANAEISTLSITQLLKTAHVLFYTYTSVCFDAMVQGVPPIFVMSEHRLSLNKLDSAPRCYWVASSPCEILQITEDLMQWSDTEWKLWYDQALEVVRSYLTPVSEDRLARFIS